jgi:hypothetical protein
MADDILCAVVGCGKKVYCKGYCCGHYNRLRRYGTPHGSGPFGDPTKKCSLSNCNNQSRHRGLCSAHYHRWQRYGDPESGSGRMHGEIEKYIHDVVFLHDTDECLEWPYKRNNGYAFWGNKNVCRMVCEIENGPPPTDKHQAAHECGRGHEGCVNRRHLRWATPSENEADKIHHGTVIRGEKTHFSKLTEADVQRIRSLEGLESPYKTADFYGVSYHAIYSIQKRINWAWME